MIKGMHALLFSNEPDSARAFFRDVMGLKFYDTGGGWLIFDLPSADLGIHPGENPGHAVSFFCDDLDTTMKEMASKGATFVGEVHEEQWGRVAAFAVPGAGEIQLYQPKYGT